MHAVTYLSSVGIGPLLALYRKVQEREGRVILCALTENVESVFHATKLIGATQGQVMRLLLREGALVGSVGALLGLPLGWLVARAPSSCWRTLSIASR